ncbi:Hsp33 family molecular chaperone HslO [Chitinimonas sp. BJB300]|uniref:Hsp33 family molecular chaperone HslO n=1 Tax=Chitinimonas sp. BJB300 TaxID=1559339 RepID=UPI000C11F773|nr:Hsp33 family molecular chaperone HslO [Chitinimonas sp. BJB300]PHV10774.1 Hsp33 family molecular chaperone HslO [Chitinimonas sp. BJB300]TSJ84517.1 Hsp33 family molecular chaperone HslO [Chitinimonas sp. BJB300]
MSQDTLQRFLFDTAPVRGEVVRLSATTSEVLKRREYPQVIQKLINELMAASALMTAMLKFEGSLIMQLHGKGRLKLVVIECESDLTMRATARWDEEAGELPNVSLVELLGEGRFVITLDPTDGGQTYQGVVGLSGNSVAAIIEHYMQSSEQLDTRLWLSSENGVAAGMMLQKLPAGHGDPNAWQHLTALAETITPHELSSLPPQELLYRLFHQESVRVMAEEHPRFGCRCSRERVGSMLKMVGREEAESVLAERGSVEVDCDFCNQHYSFDAVDIAQLFSSELPSAAPLTRQ